MVLSCVLLRDVGYGCVVNCLMLVSARAIVVSSSTAGGVCEIEAR